MTPPEQLSSKPASWFSRSWTWLAATLMASAGLAWLVLSPPTICGNELGGEHSDQAVQVCRAVQLTDPVVLAWGLIVLLLLWSTLSEGSIAGLFSFKKQVAQAAEDSRKAKETADRALLQVSQSVNTRVTVINENGVPIDVWRNETAGTQKQDSADQENQVLRRLAELAVRAVLDRLIDATGLSPTTTRAHIYTHVGGQLIPTDAPVDRRSRTWPVGTGAVGKTWQTRGYTVESLADSDFTRSDSYFISAVAAIPIVNAAERPIGILSLHSQEQAPPDLNHDQVYGAMLEAAELMARVFVNLAAWETDSAAGPAA